jgi:hypothetical protein
MCVAHYVTLLGVAESSYELQAKDDDAAKTEARRFLSRHDSVEVWEGAWWIARLTREDAPRVRGH